jgi:cytochrome-b5 reductase
MKANMSNETSPMDLTSRPPVCNLVPPDQCQFNPTFQSVQLLERIPCGKGGTSYILRFGVPDMSKPLGLTTCACVLASAELVDREKGELVAVTRPYTPISTNEQVGSFDLLVKVSGTHATVLFILIYHLTLSFGNLCSEL